MEMSSHVFTLDEIRALALSSLVRIRASHRSHSLRRRVCHDETARAARRRRQNDTK